ncbi:MAG TPA: pyruvate kinase, partial [Burkholderiales bacterium]
PRGAVMTPRRIPGTPPTVANRTRYTAREVSNGVRAERTMRGVELLRNAALAIEEEFADELQRTAPTMRESAYNLAHYLAIRRHDIRELQRELSRLGLSSLGRMEAHVMASLNAVLEVLCALRARPLPEELREPPPITFSTGDAILAENANALLGPNSAERSTRIMVTMPTEAADDPALVRDLLREGMDVMRINCAHDGPPVWERMIRHLRKAERELGRACKVSFDLAGPKLRTGEIAPGPDVAKWRPERNEFGQVTAPARVCFVREASAGEEEIAAIPVTGSLVARSRPGDIVELTDTRGRKRQLKVVEASDGGCVCESEYTAYVVPGIKLQLRRKGRAVARGAIGPLPPAARAITLRPGDLLDVASGDVTGREALFDDDGNLLAPALVGCSLPEVFRGVRVGERIFFDDGRIGGVIQGVTEAGMRVQITSALRGAAKLRGEKGINLPDSELDLPALAAKDIEDLRFAAKHGDAVAISFVQRPEDIEQLIAELKRLGASRLGIILKIETQQGFNRLPMLLMTAMRHPPVAVMVARGDLGVEVGFERLSEVQEEILWLCEAAHLPVIWATQVLESFAKSGMPSRAEVTDAAMGSRAECVMLNKGPYITDTLKFLRGVLQRMVAHQSKKTAMLRRLVVSTQSRPRRGSESAETPPGASG